MRRIVLAVCALAVAAAILWVLLPGARLVEVYPLQGMVHPGEVVRLKVVAERPWYDPRPVTVRITAGLSEEPVAVIRTRGGLVEWVPPKAGGYGVEARLGRQRAFTAVDAAQRWTERPRYGFLTDFSPQDAGQADRFETMARFHISGLQFYDWMYRHSDYLPPSETFHDPLGRLLSRSVIAEKIDLAHRHGMAAMAYTAIYGAPKEFYQAHPEWALYGVTGHPLTFANGFLYIMNPEPGGPWARHMVSEYGKIVREMNFDGIHLDQYGDPKYGLAYPGGKGARAVNVAEGIVGLIEATRDEVGPEKAVIFNNVNAWPLAETAPTRGDAIYIEVWPPHVTFDHLRQLIEDGRRRSGGKPVVLAAYVPAGAEPSVLLTDAAIFASGGYHIELGEGDKLLGDPYFPKYWQMSPEFSRHLRQYYDVAVRYQDFLYGADLTAWEPEVTVEGSRVMPLGYMNGVWTIGRQNDRYGVLHLINLNGLESPNWNAHRTEPPTPLENRQVTVAMAEPPRAVWLINPDGEDPTPRRVDFTFRDGAAHLTLERLDYWSFLVIEK